VYGANRHHRHFTPDNIAAGASESVCDRRVLRQRLTQKTSVEIGLGGSEICEGVMNINDDPLTLR
jgi:hypothetical protein